MILSTCLKPSPQLESVNGLEVFLLIQALIFTAYGVTMSYWSSDFQSSYDVFGPMIIFCFLLMLLAGFGLLLTHFRTKSERGVMYTTMVVCLIGQFYFLISVFFSKTNINASGRTFQSDLKPAWMGLTPLLSEHGASLTNAIGCALAVFVSYTALHGYFGFKMLFCHSLVTVILWEFNRQVFQRLKIQDNGGSLGVFLFGSVNGLLLHRLLNFQESTDNRKHHSSRSERVNYTLSLMGAAFIWCLLPLFNSVNISTRNNLTLGNPFIVASAINTWVALAAGLIWTFVASRMAHQNMVSVSDLLFGTFCGGIAFGSSSGIVYLPVGALVVGMLAGIINVALVPRLQRSCAKVGFKSNSLSYSFFLAGLQGGLWAIVFLLAASLLRFSTINFSLTTFNQTTTFAQAALELAGIAIAIGIACVSALISWGVLKLFGLFKCFGQPEAEEEWQQMDQITSA